MSFPVKPVICLLLYVIMAVYCMRAYTYCTDVFDTCGSTWAGRIATILTCCLLMTLDLFSTVSVLLLFLISFISLLLLFLLFFRGSLASFLFVSGSFLFHMMNVKMAVSGIFILTFQVNSRADFLAGIAYPGSILVTLLVTMIFLEIFKIVMGRQKIQTLIRNSAQITFVTTSLSFINIYLMILSVSYGSQAYSTLASLFLLCTALLLFGAFYTSFHHAVRMSVLTEYEHKSAALERQLSESNRAMHELRDAALTDTLTAAHNRRFGLLELERLRSGKTNFSLCFLDIDHLKYVNDRYGHEEGDRYILAVVRILSAYFPPPASLCRLGGDEFLILIPQCGYLEAEDRMKKAAGQVADFPVTYHPAISYGVVEASPEDGITAEILLQQADARMYQHKQRYLNPDESSE